jgi:hypothetical protein
MNPLVFTWSGTAMEILPRFAREADRRFVIGERYTLDEIQERSAASHRHYFASVNTAWASLPETIGAQFPTSEHLRKFCLIKAGFHNHRSIVARSKTEAQRIAAFVRPMDEFAIVTVSECVVNVFTAQSQSHRAMGKQQFARSKESVLQVLDDLLGVGRGETAKQGEYA